MKINQLKIRRILILGIAIALFLSLYVFYSAKKQEVVVFEGLNAQVIEYRNFIQTMSTESKAYFFCTKTNIDCRYIDTEMIDVLNIDAHVERFENIILVDTATLDMTILPSALKSRFGFSDVPAFAILSYENGSVVIHKVLQWTNTDPFTALDLKEWMKENKLWLSEYTN
ncbi:MAG: hypothetical protein HGB31_00650 [Erysipelotrichaceae bacterium]|nr:hypothetical protein [Erysipelotrichaceae bacterium]